MRGALAVSGENIDDLRAKSARGGKIAASRPKAGRGKFSEVIKRRWEGARMKITTRGIVVRDLHFFSEFTFSSRAANRAESQTGLDACILVGDQINVGSSRRRRVT